MLRLACAMSVLALVVACDEVDGVDVPSDEIPFGDAAVAPVVDGNAGDAGTMNKPGTVDVTPDASSDATAAMPGNDAGLETTTGDAGSPTTPPSCTAVTQYRDADGDGYGDPAVTRTACYIVEKTGWVLDRGDCFDGNADAHPGSEVWDSVDRGDGSFDYDCDGVETKHDTALAVCPVFTTADATCKPPSNNYPAQSGDNPDPHCYDEIIARVDAAGHDGWWGAVPSCGVAAPYGTLILFSRYVSTGYTCNQPPTASYRQICH